MSILELRLDLQVIASNQLDAAVTELTEQIRSTSRLADCRVIRLDLVGRRPHTPSPDGPSPLKDERLTNLCRSIEDAEAPIMATASAPSVCILGVPASDETESGALGIFVVGPANRILSRLEKNVSILQAFGQLI